MSLLIEFRKLGERITLRVDAPELEDLARDLHASAREGMGTGSAETPADLAWCGSLGKWEILLKGKAWGNLSFTRSEALYLHSDSLLDDLVRERLQQFPFLHAGAVVAPNGKAVAVCGGSGAGKTSVVLSCILNGWDWLSDEFLCFRHERATVAEGVRRNFNLKSWSFPYFGETEQIAGSREFPDSGHAQPIRFFDPDQLGRGKYRSCAELGAIVCPVFSKGTISPRIEPVSGPEMVGFLAPELRSTHEGTISWLAEISRSVPAFRVYYDQPKMTPAVLRGLL